MINLYTPAKKKETWEILGMIFIVCLLIALALLFPLAVVWAINTLFTAVLIPYNIWSWFSVVILGLFIRPVRIK